VEPKTHQTCGPRKACFTGALCGWVTLPTFFVLDDVIHYIYGISSSQCEYQDFSIQVLGTRHAQTAFGQSEGRPNGKQTVKSCFLSIFVCVLMEHGLQNVTRVSPFQSQPAFFCRVTRYLHDSLRNGPFLLLRLRLDTYTFGRACCCFPQEGSHMLDWPS